MFKRNYLKLVLFNLVIVLILIGCSRTETVTLGPEVNSGMTKTEVEEVIGGDELKLFKTKKGMKFFHWKGTETFLVFNSSNDTLIYKIVLFKKSAKSDLLEYFVDNEFRGPVEVKEGSVKIIVFKKNKNTGVKIRNDPKEDLIQVWVGSIVLWNKHTNKHKTLIPFPKEVFNN